MYLFYNANKYRKNTCKNAKELTYLKHSRQKELMPKMGCQVHLHDLILEYNFYSLLGKAMDCYFLSPTISNSKKSRLNRFIRG